MAPENENSTNVALVIVKVAVLIFIGIIIFNGVGSVADDDGSVQRIVTITFTGNPVDGDTITLDNYIFEFDRSDGVSGNNIPVIIGETAANTKTNLTTAIENNMML